MRCLSQRILGEMLILSGQRVKKFSLSKIPLSTFYEIVWWLLVCTKNPNTVEKAHLIYLENIAEVITHGHGPNKTHV